MGTMREAAARVKSFLAKDERDADLEAELATHLEMAVEEKMREGMSAEEAKRQALIRFGGVQQAREQQRQARGLPCLPRKTALKARHSWSARSSLRPPSRLPS